MMIHENDDSGKAERELKRLLDQTFRMGDDDSDYDGRRDQVHRTKQAKRQAKLLKKLRRRRQAG